MTRRMHRAACATALFTAVLGAQQPAVPTFEEDLTSLTRPTEPGAEPRTQAEEITAMAGFLERHATAHADDIRLLQARTRLGSLYLHACDAAGATGQFEAVLSAAPDHARDLRGRAAYGLAQAQELRGDRAAARVTLQRLTEAHAGERYAKFAVVALERLRHADDPTAKAAFDPGPLLDLDGRVHKLRDGLGLASVMVYWSPDAPSSVARLRGVCKAWKAAGGDPRRCFATALGADAARIRKLVKDLSLDCVTVRCDDEFLDPSVLAAGVTRLPTTLLIAPDGAILARDLALTELERIATRLH